MESLAGWIESKIQCPGRGEEWLRRWTQLFANRKITTRDFETLGTGDKDLVEMDALTFEDLALAKVGQFKGSGLNHIIDTVFNILQFDQALTRIQQ